MTHAPSYPYVVLYISAFPKYLLSPRYQVFSSSEWEKANTSGWLRVHDDPVVSQVAWLSDLRQVYAGTEAECDTFVKDVTGGYDENI